MNIVHYPSTFGRSKQLYDLPLRIMQLIAMALLLPCFVLISSTLNAQKYGKDYQHWSDIDEEWQGNILNKQKGAYKEGEVVPHVFQLRSQLADDTYTFSIVFNYYQKNTNAGGFVAIDQYDKSRTPNPTLTGQSIEADDDFLSNATFPSGSFYVYNADILSVSDPELTPNGNGGNYDQVVTVTFRVLDPEKEPEIYFGLRLAVTGEVTTPNSTHPTKGAAAWTGGSLQTTVDGNNIGAMSLQIATGAIITGCPTAPTVTAGNYGPLCVNGSPITLGGDPSGGSWSGPGVSFNTTTELYEFNPASAGVGTHTLVYLYTDAEGCTGSDEIEIIVNPAPELTVRNLTNVCPSNTVNLNDAVTSNTTGLTLTFYRQGSTTPLTNVTAVGAGTYVITAEDNNTNCRTSQTVTVTIITCQGCTPGYWKNRKESWSNIKTKDDALGCVNAAAGLSLTGDLKNASFWQVFGLTGLTKAQREERTGKGTENLTLLQAVSLGDGSGYTQLARAATAALMNFCALTGAGAYPYSSSSIITETRAKFQANPVNATTRQAALDLAKFYDIANNNHCPLANAVIKSSIDPAISAMPELSENNTLSVTTAPNPFRDRINFSVKVPQAGYGSLVLYNMVGQKVQVLHQGYMQAGTQNFEYRVPGGRPIGGLMYILSVGNKQVTGKLIQAGK